MAPPNHTVPIEPGDDRARHLRVGLTVFAITMALLLVVLEVVLRLAGYSNVRISKRDENRGTARMPRVQLVYTDEGFSHVRFNGAGFRDDDWTQQKPSDTLRIAILGDSYVEALQVEEHERFSEVAERELNASGAAGGRKVQVMSFGVSGYGTAQELMTLRHHVWQYSPDLVVLAITPANDIRNNLKALELDDGRPYFHYVNGELVLDESFRRSPGHNRRGALYDLLLWATDHSTLADFTLRTVRSAASRASRRRQIEKAGVAGGFEDEAGLDVWVYSEPHDADQQEAWHVTEGIIRLMNEEVRKRGSRFLAVTLSSGRQVDPDLTVRQDFMRRLSVTDLFYPERRLCALGERAGFAVLALAPALQTYAEHNGVVLHGFSGSSSGHWNQVGHREVGRLLAEQVAAMWKAPSDQVGEPTPDCRSALRATSK
jgi:lysophospholipase L1-like esterase